MKINQPTILMLMILLISLSISSCKELEKAEYTNPDKVKQKTTNYTSDQHPGKKLMVNKCYVCHHPTTENKGRIAPPMVAIKSHYMTSDITKEAFANAMWNFVEKPSKEKSKMRGAIRRFNLMPYQPFVEEEIRQIADYIYDFKIDEPEWFQEHIEEESNGKMPYRNDGKEVKSTASDLENTPAERGLEYALNTKKELGKNLMGTIQKKGVKEAVSFCNKQAYPITDSMATAQNATIKRVSDQPRNSINQANSRELEIIDKFKKAVALNDTYQPVTEVKNGRSHFYYPIMTNSLCLQCHGTTSKDIQPEVLASISLLYPEDKALGYDVNEVRGIWSISFE